MDQLVTAIPLHGRLQPPCSKSYAQRALAASLLTPGRSRLHHVAFCNDTYSALRCIEALGARVDRIGETSLEIEGGLNPRTDRLHVGESGLAARLFTPIAALCDRPIIIEGEGTLLRRPLSMMFAPLQSLGVSLRDGGGFLPIQVKGPMRGEEVEVDGHISSQFITGLLIALASRPEECTIRVKNPVSIPYIEMTLDTIRCFGREIDYREDYTEFYLPASSGYRPAECSIEGDWSAAAAWLVGGALSGEVCVENLSTLSKQADTAICRALERAGAAITCEEHCLTVAARPLRAFTFDATQSPDLFPVLVALAASAEGVSELRGTSRLEFKESNRAEVLQEIYGHLGIEIDLSTPDCMRVRGGRIRGGRCSAYGDHRIAMSLALAALRSEEPLWIEGAECVAKSYPTFFEDLALLQGAQTPSSFSK